MGHIYKITSPTGRVYVGKTIRIEKRIRDYRWRGKKRKSIVHDSINSYGWSAHKFEIIEECSDELLSEREMFWIKELNTYYVNNPMGMNLTEGGEKGGRSWKHKTELRKWFSEHFKGENGTFYGRHHTEETKKILSEKAKKRNIEKGIKVPEWGAQKGREKLIKAVVVYNNNGNFVGEFVSLSESARKLEISVSSVKDSALYGSWIDGKYLVKYKTENYPLKIEVGKIKTKTVKRAVYCLNDNLEPIFEFASAQSASDFFGIPKTTINRAALYNDLNPIRSGHIFIYKDQYLEEYNLAS